MQIEEIVQNAISEFERGGFLLVDLGEDSGTRGSTARSLSTILDVSNDSNVPKCYVITSIEGGWYSTQIAPLCHSELDKYKTLERLNSINSVYRNAPAKFYADKECREISANIVGKLFSASEIYDSFKSFYDSFIAEKRLHGVCKWFIEE